MAQQNDWVREVSLELFLGRGLFLVLAPDDDYRDHKHQKNPGYDLYGFRSHDSTLVE